jgi:hypothetical protein
MTVDHRKLKPETPQFQAELVLLLAQMCRQLLKKRSQDRRELAEPSLPESQGLLNGMTPTDRS